MPPYRDAPPSYFRRPGQVVTLAMAVTTATTLGMALGLNWAHVPTEVFALVCGNTSAILHGQVWRLLSASILQSVDHPSGLLWLLFTLYFFAIDLESDWGSKRFARFLLYLLVLPSLFQVLVDLVLPAGVRSILIPEYWFGGLAVSSGLAIAWALSAGGRTINFFGVLPITPRTLILLTVGSPLLSAVFRLFQSEGFPAVYGAMGAAWLLAGNPSTARRYWLKFRLRQLNAGVAKEATREAVQRKRRVEQSRLKVIEGGRALPESPATPEKGRGPDGRWLN